MLKLIVRTIVRNLTCGTLLLGSFAGAHALLGDGFMEMVPPAPAIAEANPAQELLDEHGCWTGEAPAQMQGVIPGHVVVTVDGGPRLGGDRMVGRALEQIFEDADHGLTVHGFCR